MEGPPKDLESETLDFKEQGRSEGDALKAIADAALCFANSWGGVVVVGVADRGAGPQALRGTTLEPDAVRKRVYELSKPSLTVDTWDETTLRSCRRTPSRPRRRCDAWRATR